MGARGFTLIELLLVVAILSATALAAFGLAVEDRAQIRVDDTRARLDILRHALLGFDTPVYGGEVRFSGYVADNGVLPDRVADLLTMPDGFGKRKGMEPDFFSSFNDQCHPTAGKTPITDEAARLMKGHRGNYLNGKAHNGIFRDGWGNIGQGDDSDNFGWRVERVDERLSFTSLGADNMVGGDDVAAADQRGVIFPTEWRVDLNGWRVTLKNKSANLLTQNFGLALLVFENTENGGRWAQFRSTGGDCPASGLGADESCALSFGDKCASGKNRLAKAPLGRHLLVLLEDNAPYEISGKKVFTQVSLYPDVDRPDITLEIR